MKEKEIKVLDENISFYKINQENYISLTDIAKKKNPKEPRFVIINWLRNRNTIEYLAIWESIYNLNFNRIGFDTVNQK